MGIYDALKDGVEVVQKAGNIEVMKKLLDAQKEALDLFEENRQLKNRIGELEEQLQLKASLRFRDNQYWLELPQQVADGPFCPTCFDIEKRLVRMHKGKSGHIYCDYCTYHRHKPAGRG